MRAELGAALEEQIRRLDVFLCRVWQLASAIGIAGGLLLSLFVEGPLGITASAVAGLLLAWFTLEAYLLARNVGTRALPLVSYAIEGTVPWAFLFILLETQGPSYALGSWAPPLLVAVLIITATARLRPLAPLLLGVTSGAVFLAMYALAIRPRLTDVERAETLYGGAMQVSRAISLSVGGLLAGVITRALRNVIGRAERSARSMDLFGKYKLREKIAAGGMGVVHRAVYCPEGGFERVVAVKLLHPHLAEEGAFLEAFRAEAELSAKLVHPNIVQVLDFGRAGDAYFLAMEFVDGLTLGALLRRLRAADERLSPAVVAYVAHEILAGLAHSHTGARDQDGTVLRVVHRDLCPANVLVSKSGEVKIGDFGIARALRDADTSETKTIAGHAAYMAPEQLRAGPIDPRWDVFAWGVMVFELFAHRPLFQRATEAETLLAIMAADVPELSSFREDLDPRWEVVVRRAVAHDPKERFTTARDALDALASLPDVGSSAGADELARLVARTLATPADAERAAPVPATDEAFRDAPTRAMPKADA